MNHPHKTWSGYLAWGTVALILFVLTLVAASWTAVLTGLAPWWVGTLSMTLAIYLAFTPMHEAAHGNISGSNGRLGHLDTVGGWLMSLVFGAPFPAFKALHLRHHGVTNDPARDPDYYVQGGHPLLTFLRCWTIVPHYYRFFLIDMNGPGGKMRVARRQVFLGLALLLTSLAALAAWGLGFEALMLWVVPSHLASGLLALAFDYIPHTPHDVQGRYVDTRSIPGPLLEVLMLGQNYHTVHHLWPKVPFYRYGTVFWLTRDELEAHGTPIGWDDHLGELQPAAGSSQ